MSNVIPIRAAAPVPLLPADEPTAPVATLPRPAVERVEYPPRRSRNGHHPDCPYHHEDPDHCGICASIRKGRD